MVSVYPTNKTFSSIFLSFSDKTRIDGSKNFLALKREGILILGQEQDSLGGYFDVDQSFSGEMSQVEFWNMKLDDLTIKVVRLN